MTWLTGWDYRKKITIIGTTFGTQTNYPMKMVVNKDIGTDISGNIYLNNHCNDNFSDIIFTSSDGITILDYYIESINSGISAIIWANIDTIPVSPGSSDIYIYYGNVGAITQSNPDNTFSLYDDGSGSDFSIKWQILAGNASYMYGWLYMYPSSMIVAKNPLPINFELIYNDTSSLYASFPAIHDIKLSKEIVQRNISRLYSVIIGPSGESQIVYTPVIEGVVKPSIATLYDAGSTILVTHVLGIGWTTSMTSSVSQPSSRSPSDALFLHFATPNNDGATNYIIVRKYVLPEPTFGTTIEETAANITATSITGTPSDPCIFGDCAVDVSVTWTNSGEATGAIIPNITIDGVAAEPIPPSENMIGGAILEKTFIVSGLATGPHDICPSPN